MAGLLTRFCRCASGTTSIEYGIIAAVMAVVIIGGSGSIKSALLATFGTINTKIAGVE